MSFAINICICIRSSETLFATLWPVSHAWQVWHVCKGVPVSFMWPIWQVQHMCHGLPVSHMWQVWHVCHAVDPKCVTSVACGQGVPVSHIWQVWHVCHEVNPKLLRDPSDRMSGCQYVRMTGWLEEHSPCFYHGSHRQYTYKVQYRLQFSVCMLSICLSWGAHV